ncbi:hypothetical protein SCUCBS95973_006535 [Sporothrix curviconia]|uniref:Uncharacterized protein n=1 Tax=Sporothrix curviconia TaxID=1260050 RepID=A0ABP0C785_9PEZI
MAKRLLVQCRSQKIPGELNERQQTLVNIACTRIWQRPVDKDQDRLQTRGMFEADNERAAWMKGRLKYARKWKRKFTCSEEDFLKAPSELDNDVVHQLYENGFRSIALVLSSDVGDYQLEPTMPGTTITIHRCVSDQVVAGQSTILGNGCCIKHFTHTVPRRVNLGGDVSDNVGDDANEGVSDDAGDNASAASAASEGVASEDSNKGLRDDNSTKPTSMDWRTVSAATAGAVAGAAVAVTVGAAALPAAGLVAAGSVVAGALYNVPWRRLFSWASDSESDASSASEKVHEQPQPPAPPTPATKDWIIRALILSVALNIWLVSAYCFGLVVASMATSWLLSTWAVNECLWATVYANIGSRWTAFEENLGRAYSSLKTKLYRMRA